MKSILTRLIERDIELVQFSSLFWYPLDHKIIGSSLQDSSSREKEKNERFFDKVCIGIVSLLGFDVQYAYKILIKISNIEKIH